MENEEKKQTGLWLKKTKNGENMMTGSWGNETIMIFKNNFKTEEKHPDYIIKFKPKNMPEQFVHKPTTIAHEGFKISMQGKPVGDELPF